MADIFKFELPSQRANAEAWQELTIQIDRFVDQVFELDQFEKVSAVGYLLEAIKRRMAKDRL